VRECQVVDFLIFDSGKVAAVASVRPSVIGQEFGIGEEINTVYLTTRLEGASIDRINEFPCFVFIAIPSGGKRTLSSPIRKDDLHVIGWGELYGSAEDARKHKF
jgi:hypothetical protein